MDVLTPEQRREIAKYPAAYKSENYCMKPPRFAVNSATLRELPWREGYLDVSCGRGEMIKFAKKIGFAPVAGTEVVPGLLGGAVVEAVAWSLPFPDKSFDVVSLFDVIEHVLPGDDEKVCRELARVARHAILISANNHHSMHGDVELHVNKRPYAEWAALFAIWFGGTVDWLHYRRAKNTELWRVTFA